ncbi:hypothetical protein DYQ86_24250 [Acidobacteria bacterium AB60]|nr:hypothetical protein DYQ86_24250 [Acidobacteria bacterium AB60]
MKTLFPASLLFALAAALPAPVSAQQPKVSNAQVKVEALDGGLSATVDRIRHSADRVWIGYQIAALPGHHIAACSDWNHSDNNSDDCCGEFRLEDDQETHVNREPQEPQNVYVLLRYEKASPVRVRIAGAGCRLNAGGVNFSWLPQVTPQDSLALLATLVNQQADDHRVMEGALFAISAHAAPEATSTLVQIATSASSEHLREQAAFWLGVQRGHEGFLALKSLEEKWSGDARLREKLTFDFSQNSDPGAEDELIRMAKNDPEAKVRGQALFWIAQKAGKHATQTLTESIQNDPETDVKKKAVFALSQLPKDEGVPQLIHVAETNTNPAVRKDAYFWLGQSQDPRALAFLEQVLKR